MKIEMVSDEFIEVYKTFVYTTYQKKPAINIDVKLTKPLKAEVSKILSAFGGFEYAKNKWQFSYDVSKDLDRAVSLGYYPNLMENSCLFPPLLVLSAMAHIKQTAESALFIFPGYGVFAQALAARNSNTQISTVYDNNLCESIPVNRVHYENLQNIKEQFDVVIMRPSFMGHKDIEMVYQAYDKIKPGGKLITFIKSDIDFCLSKECKNFRKWLEDLNSNFYQVDSFCWSRNPLINLSVYMLIISK